MFVLRARTSQLEPPPGLGGSALGTAYTHCTLSTVHGVFRRPHTPKCGSDTRGGWHCTSGTSTGTRSRRKELSRECGASSISPRSRTVPNSTPDLGALCESRVPGSSVRVPRTTLTAEPTAASRPGVRSRTAFVAQRLSRAGPLATRFLASFAATFGREAGRGVNALFRPHQAAGPAGRPIVRSNKALCVFDARMREP